MGQLFLRFRNRWTKRFVTTPYAWRHISKVQPVYIWRQRRK